VPQFAEYAVLRLTVSWTISGLARALAVAGYAVFGMDYPGFGLSEGLHGYIQYRIIKGEAHSHCFTLTTLS
jgi:hypothetical protein